jgi:hypothetical protein
VKLKEIMPHAVAINEISPLGWGTYKFINCFNESFFEYPRLRETVEVYASDGIIEGFKGEIYTSPMYAVDTYRRVSLIVKKGELVIDTGRDFKKIISEPPTVVLRIVR